MPPAYDLRKILRYRLLRPAEPNAASLRCCNLYLRKQSRRNEQGRKGQRRTHRINRPKIAKKKAEIESLEAQKAGRLFWRKLQRPAMYFCREGQQIIPAVPLAFLYSVGVRVHFLPESQNAIFSSTFLTFGIQASEMQKTAWFFAQISFWFS